MPRPAATAAPRAAMGGLPAFLTSFVGREREREALLRQLRTSRLVTILGPGGAGKTRIAVETARAWFDANPADAWFVDLSSLAPSAAVAPAIARALGLGDDRLRSPLDAVVAFFRQGRDLLVLDNCEHVIEESASVAEQVLQQCLELRIIATSREPLGVPGERRFPVPPLDTATEAVGLFVERARLVDPSFALSADNARDIAGICDRLDGLPLAVELAAASLRALSLTQLRDRLGRSRDVLASPSRSTPTRQRTLHAAIEWSHDLLPEQERQLFARLAVFSGGWTLEAAEGICAGDGIEEHEVLPLLASLVDRSLVTLDGGSGRYGMLETIREFAAEQLGDGDDWRRRHAEWFADWAEREAPSIWEALDADLPSRAEAEQDNVRLAILWSIEPTGNVEFGLRIVARLSTFWGRSHRVEEGTFWANAVIDHPVAAAHPELRLDALVQWLQLKQLWQMEPDDPPSTLLKELIPQVSDAALRAHAECALAARLVFGGDVDGGVALLRQALASAEERRDGPGRIRALLGLAEAARQSQDWVRHLQYCEQARTVAHETEDRWGEAGALVLLGSGLLDQRRGADAEGLFARARALDNRIGATAFDVSVGAMTGYALLLQNRLHDAALQFRETISLAGKWGVIFQSVVSVGGFGIAIGLSGNPTGGTQLLARAARSLDEVEGPQFPRERDALALGLKLVRAQLPITDFESAVAAGEALSLEEAAEMALALDLPAEGATRRAASPSPVTPSLPARLTEREAEVLRLLAAGRTNRAIAAELVLSVRTVETHIFNAYAKIGAGGRAEATAWAIAHGLLTPTT